MEEAASPALEETALWADRSRTPSPGSNKRRRFMVRDGHLVPRPGVVQRGYDYGLANVKEPWEMHFSNKWGLPYFWNWETRVAVWELPFGFEKAWRVCSGFFCGVLGAV